MREKGKSEDAIATELARRSAYAASSGASALRLRAAERPRAALGGAVAERGRACALN